MVCAKSIKEAKQKIDLESNSKYVRAKEMNTNFKYFFSLCSSADCLPLHCRFCSGAVRCCALLCSIAIVVVAAEPLPAAQHNTTPVRMCTLLACLPRSAPQSCLWPSNILPHVGPYVPRHRTTSMRRVWSCCAVLPHTGYR